MQPRSVTAERSTMQLQTPVPGFRDRIREARPNESPTARIRNPNKVIKLEIIVYTAPVRITFDDDNCPFYPRG